MIGQALADGILTGAIIALGAIGVSFTLQIMRFANFAHSELLTWGAYRGRSRRTPWMITWASLRIQPMEL